jgi:Conserved TM helix
MLVAAVNFQGGIENAWSNVATFLPKLAAALLILVVGYFVAKLISRILDRVLERVGFDRMVERGGLRQALARSKYDPSDILAKVVFWAVMLFVLQLAFGVFGSNPISDLLRGLIAYLPNIFVAILIVVIAAAIAKAATDLLSSLLSGMQGGQLLARGAGIAILVFAAFAALDQLQVAPRIVTGLWYAILAAVVGSVIVAVGGGGIRTMQRYWDRMAGKAEERGPELRQQAQTSAAQARADQRYGDGRTAEYPSTQGASAADLYDTGSGQGARTRRGR